MDVYLIVLRLRLKTNPNAFPNEWIAFLDTTFNINGHDKHKLWLKNNKFHPGGSLDYLNGKSPANAQIDKRLGVGVDVLYGVLFFIGNHWVAMIISIHKRTFEVMDSSIKYTKDREVNVAVEPFAQMVPHLLWFVAPPCEKVVMSTEPYEILPRDLNLPVNKDLQGGCGVYALKFIECHALGIVVLKALCDRNMDKIWTKMAVDFFEHTFKYAASTSDLEKHM